MRNVHHWPMIGVSVRYLQTCVQISEGGGGFPFKLIEFPIKLKFKGGTFLFLKHKNSVTLKLFPVREKIPPQI